MNIYMAAGGMWHLRLLEAIKYPNRLLSYHYWKMLPQEHGLDFGTADWIMDSGLFTMMFGGGRRVWEYDELKRYACNYVEDMHRIGWKHRIVECDIQRILSPEACAKLREEVFDQSGFEVIYVWHVEERLAGLQALAKRRHMALSIPELRLRIPGHTLRRSEVSRLISMVRAHGDATIHLLGNTETPLCLMPADSSDSSSWLGPSRWGLGAMFSKGAVQTIRCTHPSFQAWTKWCANRWPEKFAAVNAVPVGPSTKKHVWYCAATALAFGLLAEKSDAVNKTTR